MSFVSLTHKPTFYLILLLGISTLFYAYGATPFISHFASPMIILNRPFQGAARAGGLYGLLLSFLLLASRLFLLKGITGGFQIRSSAIFCLAMMARSAVSIVHAVPFNLPNILLWFVAFLISLRQSSCTIRSKLNLESTLLVALLAISILTVLLNLLLYTSLGSYNSTVHQGRLLGSFAHPQFAAVSLVCCSILLLEFRLRLNRLRFQDSPFLTLATRPFVLNCFIAISIYLVLLTGSRTGLSSLVFGIILSFYFSAIKVSKLLFFSIFILFVLAFVFAVTPDLFFSDSRSFSDLDTRSNAWQSLWMAFLSNPLIGVGNPSASESSPLMLAASQGLFGLLIYFFPIFRFLRLSTTVSSLSSWKRSSFLSPSLFLSVYFASLFEGVLAADTFSLPLYFIFIYLLAFDCHVSALRYYKHCKHI